jgi:hypothetical protein
MRPPQGGFFLWALPGKEVALKTATTLQSPFNDKGIAGKELQGNQ